MGREIIVDEALLSALLRHSEAEKVIPGIQAIAMVAETKTCCGGRRTVRTHQDLSALKRALLQASPTTLNRLKAHLKADKLIFYTTGPMGLRKVEK